MTGPTPVLPPAAAGPAGSGAGAVGQAAAGARSVGEVVLEQVPARLAGLGRAVVLTGMPDGRTGDGALRLRTQMGEILLRPADAFPPDRPVTLQIPAASPPGSVPVRALAFTAGSPATPPQAGPPAMPAPPPAPTPIPAPAAYPLPGTAVPATVMAAGTVAPAAMTDSGGGTAMQPAAIGKTGSEAAGAAPPIPPRSAPASAVAAYGAIQAGSGAGAARPAATAAPAPMPGSALPAPVPAPAVIPPPVGHASSPGAAPPGSTAPVGASAPPAPAGPFQPAAGHPGRRAPSAASPAEGIRFPTPAGQPAPSAPAMPPPSTAMATAEMTGRQAPVTPVAPAATSIPADTAPVLPAAGLRPGTAVTLHVLSLPAAGAGPQPAPAPMPAGPSLAGTVTGTSAGSGGTPQAVLSTQSGVVLLQPGTPLPVGTRVALTLAPAAAAPSFDPLNGGDWPALRRTLDALVQADAGGARSLMAQILPQAGPRLAAAMAHFTGSVAKGADARRWLGEKATRLLEAEGRSEALSALDGDFKALGRQAAEPLQGEWRAWSMPFSDGQEISRIHLFVRQAGDDEEGGESGRPGGRARRFVLELELSRLGPIQLDGLVRDKRFDLILRMRDSFPDDMRREIQGIFTRTLAALGLSGDASFQAGGRGWVSVRPKAGPDRGVLA